MANINNLKKSSIMNQYIQKTLSIVKTSSTDYIESATPTFTEIGKGVREASSTIMSIPNSAIFQKVRELNRQPSFRKISNWFNDSGKDFDIQDHSSSDLEFDIDTSDVSDIQEAQISEMDRNSNKVAAATIGSSEQIINAQISSTANIITSIDRMNSSISTQLRDINSNMASMLEVLTSNTSRMIQLQTADLTMKTQESSNQFGSNNQFNMSEWKKSIKDNLDKSELGIVPMMAQMMMSPGMITPESIGSLLFTGIMDSKFPNVKKNLAAVDSAVNNILMSSLARLGENRDWGILGSISRIFGISSDRRNISTERSSLELKPVPFDTVTKEAITQTIPGYLKEIVVLLGGKEKTYDYKNRKFKSYDDAENDFRDITNRNINSYLYNGSGYGTKLNRANIRNDKKKNALNQLFFNQLSGMDPADAREFLSSMDESSIRELLNPQLKGTTISSGKKDITEFIRNILTLSSEERLDLHSNVRMFNISNNRDKERYIEEQHLYGNDISRISDKLSKDNEYILKDFTKTKSPTSSLISSVQIQDSEEELHYSNNILYDIFRRLDKGINVFKVGEDVTIRGSRQFKSFSHIKPPSFIVTGTKSGDDDMDQQSNESLSDSSNDSSSKPRARLTDRYDEDGNELTAGERTSRWAKSTYGNFSKAMLSGNPKEIQRAVYQLFGDVKDISKIGINKGLTRVNDTFGNISGHIKHTFTGAAYDYQNEDGNWVRVAKNDKGGLTGYISDNVKSFLFGEKDIDGKVSGGVINTGKNYISSVLDMFKSKDETPTTAQKRKQFISTAIGSLAGGSMLGGILGGPLGMLVGGVAGSAFSAAGIGNRIKEFFIGGEGKDGKGKLGIFEKIGNAITDPLRFQIEKTFHSIGASLKKNLFGPLADLGKAIFNRVTKPMSDMAKNIFGGLFKFIGKALMIPVNIARAPINFMGNLARGIGGAGLGITGTGLNILSDIIDPDNRKDRRERRRTRNEEIDAEFEETDEYSGGTGLHGIFGVGKSNYRVWKEEQDRKRLARKSKFSSYFDSKSEILTPEEYEKIKEEEERNKENAKNLAKIADDKRIESRDKFYQAGLEKGSIYTHDEGTQTRLDAIIDIIGGKKDSDISKSDLSEQQISGLGSKDNDSIVGHSITAAATIATEGSLGSEDVSETSELHEEALSDKPNRSKISSLFDRILKRNKDVEEDNANKEKSGLSKIADTGKNLIGGIAGAISNIPGIGSIAPILLGAGLLNKLGLLDPLIGFLTDTALPWVTDTVIPKIGDVVIGAAPAIAGAIGKVIPAAAKIGTEVWKALPWQMQAVLGAVAVSKGVRGVWDTAKGVSSLVNTISGTSGTMKGIGTIASSAGGIFSGLGSGLASLAANPITWAVLAAVGAGAVIYKATAPSKEMKSQEKFIELSDGSIINRKDWEAGKIPDKIKNSPELMDELNQKRQEANWGLAALSEDVIGNKRGWDWIQNKYRLDKTGTDDYNQQIDVGRGIKMTIGQALEDFDSLSPEGQANLIKGIYNQKASMFLGTKDSLALRAYELGLRADGKPIKNIDKDKSDIISALVLDIFNKETGIGSSRKVIDNTLVNVNGSAWLLRQFMEFEKLSDKEKEKYVSMLVEHSNGNLTENLIRAHMQESYSNNAQYRFTLNKNKDLFGKGKLFAKGLTDSIFSQYNPMYESLGMADNGCGPTALAFAMNKSGMNIDPAMMNMLMKKDGSLTPDGTSPEDMATTASSLGFDLDIDNNNREEFLKQLRSGKPAIMLGSGSEYDTNNGEYHYMTATGLDSQGNAIINNPFTGKYGKSSVSSLLNNTNNILYPKGRGEGGSVLSGVFKILKDTATSIGQYFFGDMFGNTSSNKNSKYSQERGESTYSADSPLSDKVNVEFNSEETPAPESWKDLPDWNPNIKTEKEFAEWIAPTMREDFKHHHILPSFKIAQARIEGLHPDGHPNIGVPIGSNLTKAATNYKNIFGLDTGRIANEHIAFANWKDNIFAHGALINRKDGYKAIVGEKNINAAIDNFDFGLYQKGISGNNPEYKSWMRQAINRMNLTKYDQGLDWNKTTTFDTPRGKISDKNKLTGKGRRGRGTESGGSVFSSVMSVLTKAADDIKKYFSGDTIDELTEDIPPSDGTNTEPPPTSSQNISMAPAGFYEKNVKGSNAAYLSAVIGKPINHGFMDKTFHPDGHLGIDIAAAAGTPVPSTVNGTVIWSKMNGAWGNQVLVKADKDGTIHSFNHLSKFAVSAGQKVIRGQIIGYIGTTGYSTGNHLDYSVGTSNTYNGSTFNIRSGLIDPTKISHDTDGEIQAKGKIRGRGSDNIATIDNSFKFEESSGMKSDKDNNGIGGSELISTEKIEMLLGMMIEHLRDINTNTKVPRGSGTSNKQTPNKNSGSLSPNRNRQNVGLPYNHGNVTAIMNLARGSF